MFAETLRTSANSWNSRSLLTVAEVAEWAHVHPKTVYRWIQEGKLDTIQFGPRLYRVPEDAISKFLKKCGYGDVPSPHQDGKNGAA